MDIARTEPTHITRPLHVLVPLIKQDLEQAREISERAGLPYYRAAGIKMIEAKPQMAHGSFGPWVKRNFKISEGHARKYMALAKATSGKQTARVQDFSSLNEFVGDIGRSRPTKTEWHEPVSEAIGRVNIESMKQDALKRQEERALQRKLALSLIDIGYKVLATKLHPDKGGSREAMARLNRVRALLREAVSS